MKSALRWIIAFVFILVLPGAFYMAAKNGLFRVQVIETLTEESLPPSYASYLEDLRSELKALEGHNLWDIDLKNVTHLVREKSWVSDVRVYRRFPHTLRIELNFKPAVAQVLNLKGRLQLLASDGGLLPEIDPMKSPRLPVIQNKKIVSDIELRNKIAEYLNEIPKTGRLSLNNIAEIHISRSQEFWLTDLITQSPVKLGADNVALKSARASKVLEYLDHNQMKWRVVDANFSKKVLVRLRNDK